MKRNFHYDWSTGTFVERIRERHDAADLSHHFEKKKIIKEAGKIALS